MQRNYNYSGNKSNSVEHIEDHADVQKSGNGSLVIGSIGNGVTMIISGNGLTRITGTVGEGGKFVKTGNGYLEFLKRPSDSIVENIEYSGNGVIDMPGGFNRSKKPSSRSVFTGGSSFVSSVSTNSYVASVISSTGGNVTIGGMQISGMKGAVMSNDGDTIASKISTNMSKHVTTIQVGQISKNSTREILMSEINTKCDSKRKVAEIYYKNSTREQVGILCTGSNINIINGKFILDDIEITDNDPRVTMKVITDSNNGEITVKQGDHTQTYSGRHFEFVHDQLFIDGNEVKPDDARLATPAEVTETSFRNVM